MTFIGIHFRLQTKAPTQLDVCLKKGDIRHMLGCLMIGVMIHWQKHAGLMAHKLWGKKLWGNRGCWWQEGEWQMFTNLPTFASRERDCMCFLLSRCKMASLRSAGQVVLKWVSPQWTLALKGCSHYKGLGLYSVHDTTDRPKRSFEQIPLSRDFSLST